MHLEDETDNVHCIFDTIIEQIDPPSCDMDGDMQMLVSNIDYDEYLGRIAVGRVERGKIKAGMPIVICKQDKNVQGKIAKLFTYMGLKRTEVEEADAGDIVALSGIADINIGDTICDINNPEKIPFVDIDEPTVSMTFSVNNGPLAGKEGEFVTSRHIRDRLMKELERNNEITEQSYIDKSNFIFEMTQEVREPLNYIKNTSKVLIDNNTTKDEYKEGLGYIYNASRQLDFVVNDVLNVSTLDVQKVKVLNNRYNLDRLYEDLIKRVEPSINNNVKFRYSIPNNIPYLYGDNIKLKQVLYSLLMNAVKKTENGFIEFNVNTIEKYDVCRVIFRITDSGCGIGLEKINEILSVTGELNKEDIENLEKSEFNIELCQKIIKSLGGNLLIKSKLGKGTEVILTIDQKIYREEEKIVNNNNYGTKKVLVVCQDKKIREIIKKVLNENEINGSYILYGLDAVDRIKSGKKYDYIIIEDEMKEINGYETIKKLKNLKEFKIPCIVLLNENKEKIKKYYIKDGYSDYILTRELRNELKRIIDKY